MPSSNILKLEHVTKSYGRKHALKDVSVTFSPGKINVLLGGNGSGKSTLMRCVMRHLGYEGRIERPARRIGYAPQRSIMPRDMAVRDLLVSLGKIKQKNQDRIIWELCGLMKRFGMDDCLTTPIRALSDGMKHKVNLIQALMNEPRMILLDEPFANLDRSSSKHVRSILKQRMTDTLILVATHQNGTIQTKFKQSYHLSDGRLTDG